MGGAIVTGRSVAIRRQVIRLSHEARSAHLGSSLSCVEILDAILTVADVASGPAERLERDRVIMSKGHAAMAYYSALVAHGLLDSSMIGHYLSDGSTLWGHVTRSADLPVIDASTGSLGHGLGLAVGFALGQQIMGWSARSFCVLSDGECDEGSTWEAVAFAGHHQLGNLVAVVDYNEIQSLDRCENVLSKANLPERFRSFGWSAEWIDGHDVDLLVDRLRSAVGGRRPLALVARTVKGRGIPRIEGTVASHYEPARAGDVEPR